MKATLGFRGIAAALGVVLVVTAIQFAPATGAAALTGADFSAGNIISDKNFFDAASLSESQVQSFLTSQNCVPRDGVPCLRDFTQSTPTVSAVGGGHCAQYSGAANESASRILSKVAGACGISPKVLLVLLQKEQSLVTSPSAYGYQRAMGWGCPDSGPNYSANCDANYFGFFNQVYKSAWQFRQYTQYPLNIPGESGTRKYHIGTVYIQNHPNVSCGGSNVYIQNQATANLYLYTPYQPNASALANLYGSGDACGAYGNRNFWRIFSDWFGQPAGSTLSPVGNFDSGSATMQTATLRGWAFDPETAAPVDVHLYVNGGWGGSFTADKSRSDVGAAYPSYGPNHGFEISFPVLPGSFEACIFAINVGVGGNEPLGCKTVTTPTGPPVGNVESAVLSDRQLTLNGWAIDVDTPNPTSIHVYVNGKWGGAFPADQPREDVSRAYPGYGSNHGFNLKVGIPPGTSNVCVYAINVGVGYNQSIGCQTASTASGPPIGNIDAVQSGFGSVSLSGWAIDPDVTDSIGIHVYVDGRWAGAFPADAIRDDVAEAFPGYGPNHGFLASVAVPGGTSTVCAYAINVGSGFNQSVGCRTVTTPGGSPFGSLDSVSVGAGIATMSGWTIDPDSANPVSVHVYVDGRWGGAYQADSIRDDVGAVYPNYGPKHGFRLDVAVPAGAAKLCAYAINLGIGQNQLIGCRSIAG
ncbi:hypothetical protein [Cryobacterium fucosi]|uniref:Hemagglutinin n=1 Tax=Cryobacterium fucosi TaxID=1259157 RepID=A0A4R9BEX2_9MICO|nr:hypothetical protein [Cryobacterium fucosi]TFD82682.1 hypothetical protein E3T48_01650 [Cryobacterium fucosi]